MATEKNEADLQLDNDQLWYRNQNGEPDLQAVHDAMANILTSYYNKLDVTILEGTANITKAALGTAISGNALSAGQTLCITDRADGQPLYIICLNDNTISPYGVWVLSGKPLLVTMDWAGGRDGESGLFLTIQKPDEQIINGKISATGSLQFGGGAVLAKTLFTQVQLDFDSVDSQESQTLTLPLNEAELSDVIMMGIPSTSEAGMDGGTFEAWVSSANTVSVKFTNASAGALNPSAGLFSILIFKMNSTTPSGGALYEDRFTTTDAVSVYNRPAILGKVISHVLYNQVVMLDSDYTLVGTVFTLGTPPSGANIVKIIYEQ